MIYKFIDLLKEDLGLFSDQTPQVEVIDGELRAKWISIDIEHSAVFSVGPDNALIWHSEDGHQLPYAKFLASPKVSNLNRVSKAIADRYKISSPKAIKSPATVVDRAHDTPKTAEEAIAFLLSEFYGREDDKTNIIFVKGEAGAGKTFLLQNLARSYAENFSLSSSSPIMLFVSAQGRSLANLKDILARELQDLRALQITYAAIPLLSRSGLVIPVIDAFDELLGAAGYGDAFGSLQEFLQELDGKGIMIVSARSAFFETEFRARYGVETSARYDVTPIELERWQQNNVREYLTINDPAGDSLQRYERLSEKDHEILTKPFFAYRFLEFNNWPVQENPVEASSLIDFLMRSYVQRESGKLIGRDNRPLLTEEQQAEFLTELAIYMWQNQTRDLDRKSLELIVDIRGLEENFNEDQLQQFKSKATSNAGLENRGGVFDFEHDVYFDFFLARRFASATRAGSKENLVAFLQYGQFTSDFARFVLNTEATSRSICEVLGSNAAGDLSVYGENVRRNRGALAAALLSGWSHLVEGQRIRDIELVGVDISRNSGRLKISNASFLGCKFIKSGFTECDLDEVDFSMCEFEQLRLARCTLSKVRGLVPGLNIQGLVIDNYEEIWDPNTIVNSLQQIGWSQSTSSNPDDAFSDRAKRVIRLLRRFASKTRRTNVFVLDTEDHRSRDVIGDSAWSDLQVLLEKHELVRAEAMAASGPKKIRLRLSISPELLLSQRDFKAAPTNQRAFWAELTSLS